MKLVVMIPAYNEEETVADVIAEIPRQMDGIDNVEILIINDGSTDRTVEVAKKAGADNIISHKMNQGLGVAFKNGLIAALEMGADVIVNIDADGQYNAEEIPKLIEPILNDTADVVLGWRDIPKLKFMPIGKRIGNRIASWVARKLSGLPIKDAQTGYRAFSRDSALRLNLLGKFTYVQETLIQAKYKGLKVEQVPVEFRERKGKSRLISNITTYARRAGALMLRTYRDYQPLKLFSITGGIFSLIGLGLGIRVLVHFIRTGFVTPYLPTAVVASLLMIIGVLIIIFGLFADIFKNQRLLQEEILYWLKKEGHRDGK